ncbi:GTPase-associated system all-helical protein GASH [Prosthecobacter sp.]|uniref:GTPase-associated system all-helical protein GASH n=1 Tax=Prosthecobacter sp. TaxID=1965333 RepID=UPI003783D2E3
MHKHTIDWFRQINITADQALAQRRWSAAEAVAKKVSRPSIVGLLKLFLFPNSDTAFATSFTDELVALDPEFPVSQNHQELRLMAGLVMVTTFSKSSSIADAFGLGLCAANFPTGRVSPAQAGMVAEALSYLQNESARLRPNAFASSVETATKKIAQKEALLVEVEATEDPVKLKAVTSAYRKTISEAITFAHGELDKRVQQLAEETGLLWWVLSEYSESLNLPVCEIAPEAYALVAAAEAATRTFLMPPPPSIKPLLSRVLKLCKREKKNATLADYLGETDSAWRANQVKTTSIADCRDIVPIFTALEKTEEINEVSTVLKLLPKLCVGFNGDIQLTASAAAKQYYNEIVFIRALEQAFS